MKEVVKVVEMLEEATQGSEGGGEAERRQRRRCGAASGGCVWEAAMEAREWPAARSFGAQTTGTKFGSPDGARFATSNR